MNIPRKALTFITLLFLMSIGLLVFLFRHYSISSLWVVIFWGLLAAITESLMIFLPNGLGVSVGFAINLAVIVVGGPLTATLVSAVGFLFRVPRKPGIGYVHLFNTDLYKTVFNTSQSIIITGTSGLVYLWVGGEIGYFSLIPVLLVLVVDVVMNSVITAIVISFLKGKRFINIWIEGLKGMLPSALAVGIIGIIIAIAYLGYGPGAVLLFFGPLLLARHSFKQYLSMRSIYLETIQALNKTTEAKDAYTSGHASRVQEYAVKLAQAMGLSEKSIKNIQTAALLHDIGKIGVDDRILKKPDKLTNDEYEVIKRHPDIGADILENVDFLKDIAEIIRHHHERYDGKGYPHGLAENTIPLEAMILALADVYDAITSDRPYRKGLTKEYALEEIRRNAGTQFDPSIAERFISIMSV